MPTPDAPKPHPPAQVRDASAMIAGMRPILEPGEFVFCTTRDDKVAEAARPEALALFREAEGLSLILPIGAAERLGFAVGKPMRRIVLTVLSALDGVGLTAAAAGALAAEGLACNVVAAFHHDHLFVSSATAERALAVLEARAAAEGRAPDGAGPLTP